MTTPMTTTAPTCPRCSAPLTGAVAGLCLACLLAEGMQTETVPHGHWTPPAPEELSRRFDDLDVLELLGYGGMGAVYLARQRGLDRSVALKIVRPSAASDPAFAERFVREARALARLDHPSIVRVHSTGTAGDLPYLLMEYVDGPTLRQMMDAGPLGAADAMTLIPRICEALQYAHDAGIVHRDLKPANILVDADGQPKIADFGLAKLGAVGDGTVPFTLTQAGAVMGTPRYMSPEQLQGSSDIDHRTDLYALGVVLYEMLTGGLPVGVFDPPSECGPVDARLDPVVLKSLHKAPEKRYQQASELKRAFEAIDAEPAPAPSPQPEAAPSPQPEPESDLRPVGVVAVLADVASQVVGGGVWMLVMLFLLLETASWWPLLGLFVPGLWLAGVLAEDDVNPTLFAWHGILPLWLIGMGIWQLGSAAPLLALLPFYIGFRLGQPAEEVEPGAPVPLRSQPGAGAIALLLLVVLWLVQALANVYMSPLPLIGMLLPGLALGICLRKADRIDKATALLLFLALPAWMLVSSATFLGALGIIVGMAALAIGTGMGYRHASAGSPVAEIADPAPAKSADDEDEAATLVYLAVLIGTPIAVVAGVYFSHVWYPLLGLVGMGICLGAYLADGSSSDPVERWIFAAGIPTAAVLIVVWAFYYLQSAGPLMGLVAFGVGTQWATEEEKEDATTAEER